MLFELWRLYSADRNYDIIINSKQVRIYKGVVVPYVEIISFHSVGVNEKSHA